MLKFQAPGTTGGWRWRSNIKGKMRPFIISDYEAKQWWFNFDKHTSDNSYIDALYVRLILTLILSRSIVFGSNCRILFQIKPDWFYASFSFPVKCLFQHEHSGLMRQQCFHEHIFIKNKQFICTLNKTNHQYCYSILVVNCSWLMGQLVRKLAILIFWFVVLLSRDVTI